MTGGGRRAWSVLTARKSVIGRILNKGSRSTLRARRQTWGGNSTGLYARGYGGLISRLWGIGGCGCPVIKDDGVFGRSGTNCWVADPGAQTRHLQRREAREDIFGRKRFSGKHLRRPDFSPSMILIPLHWGCSCPLILTSTPSIGGDTIFRGSRPNSISRGYQPRRQNYMPVA